MLLFAGRNDEAIAQCRKTLEMDSNFEHAHWLIGWAYHQKGQAKEFLEELEKAGSTGLASGTPGIVFALKGKRAEARRVLAQLQQNYTSGIIMADVYVYLGDKDRAFASLEKAFEDRNGALILMRVAPEFAPIRSDPRFEQLARRVGLPPAKPSP